jgi:hypothetical protein
VTGAELLRCPVCRAGFRATALCSRCGADLTRLMGLAASAWRFRESARRALRERDFAAARDLAAQAQRLHATPAGRSVWLVAAWSARQHLSCSESER